MASAGPDNMNIQGASADPVLDAATAVPSTSKLSHQEKLETAKQYKLEGNAKYKDKLYKPAIGKYHRALLYLKGIEAGEQASPFGFAMGDLQSEQRRRMPEEMKQEVSKLKIDCYNNLSACILQTDSASHTKVVQYCDEVLAIDSRNIKALYRKGVALQHLKDPEAALEVLYKAQKLPDGEKDTNIRRQIALCEKDLGKQDQKMKKTYQAMFNNLSTNDNEEKT